MIKTSSQVEDRPHQLGLIYSLLIATRSQDCTCVDCVLVDFVSGRVIPGEIRFENLLWSRRFTKSVPLKLYLSNNDEDIIIFNKSFKFRYFSFVFFAANIRKSLFKRYQQINNSFLKTGLNGCVVLKRTRLHSYNCRKHME